MSTRIPVTVLPGDGIGPEVMKSTIRVLEAVQAPFAWDVQRLGEIVEDETTNWEAELRVSYAARKSITNNKLALKGPTATPLGTGHRSLNVELRKMFALYANIRPVKTMPGVKTRFSDLPIDLVIFRENLEDFYIGEERGSQESATATSRMTWDGSARIAQCAFEYAKKHKRRKVTVVHKANILKKTHGLFLGAAKDVAGYYPGVECEDLIADNFMMQMVRNPERFDCILAPNFLGDLISDLAAGLIGGLGFAPGANIGEQVSVFEAVHGTAPDIAGKGIANPTAMILSGAMILEHTGYADQAGRIRHAIDAVLLEGRSVTGDVSRTNPVSTEVFTEAVVSMV